jgi:hypothetical protein
MPASLPPPGGPLQRICAEYLEMPGLQLTGAQVQRLCGLDEATCASALETLVDLRFLRLTPAGLYVRNSEGASMPSASAIEAIHAATGRRRTAR